MSDGLKRLREIGAQKIHEQTHIARHHVQALLHEAFEDMTKIQMQGFISILQREYDVDLSEFKAKVDEYYFLNAPEEDDSETRFFVSPTRKKKYTFVYVLIAIAIFAVAIFFTLDKIAQSSEKTDNHSIDNSAIKNAQQSMLKSDKLETLSEEEIEDENATITEIEEEEKIAEAEVTEVIKSFKILPKVELWIGYIDLSNHKKYQKLFKGELELNPNKDWLLSLGHGNVNIEIDGVVKEFNDRSNLRLLYKDSKLSKISFTEFKELNRGQKW
ncbi:hypothetical protein M947_06185 [Sulfurimonas hongkongensis]|uniref:Uncharacterized protein n=1 Tax=Sulfurimonas hongkongensis TaxID=1172190 RepID=T0L1D3_9BACT|nr:hypothetical protein [Sulfurimonas hongkongensis]EQB39578.1 hypothetical protein M947_06185 [Sulfurimonas hongkongensis]